MPPIFKKFNKLLSKLKFNIFVTIEFYTMLRDVLNLDILKLSIMHFSSKFINMVVMFLPIKIFLLLETTSSIESLSTLEHSLGRKGYVILLLSLTSVLYLINILLQSYRDRLLNKQLIKIELPKYAYGKHTFTKKALLKLYKPCYLAIADLFMIIISTVVFFFLSVHFALAFISVFVFYLIFVEYFIFTDNKFKLLQRLKLDQNQSVTILASILYLTLFFAVFYIFIVFSPPVYSAILMLLLARLANASIKGFIVNQHKLVNGFPSRL